MENKPINEIMGGELYHYNHNHDALGRFASSAAGSARSIGGSIVKKAKKTISNSSDVVTKKSRNQKSAESKEEIVKQEKTARQRKEALNKAIRTGDAKTVYEHRTELTDKQLEDAIRRINKNKELREIVVSQTPSKVKKINDVMDKATEYNEILKKGLSIYKTASEVKDIVDKKQKANEREEKNKKISEIVEDTSRLSELYDNRKDYSKESIEKAVKKYEAEQKLKRVLEDQNGTNSFVIDSTIDTSSDHSGISEKHLGNILKTKGKKNKE